MQFHKQIYEIKDFPPNDQEVIENLNELLKGFIMKHLAR